MTVSPVVSSAVGQKEDTPMKTEILGLLWESEDSARLSLEEVDFRHANFSFQEGFFAEMWRLQCVYLN